MASAEGAQPPGNDDSAAAKHDMVRIIDEEGEDYLYPAGWFLAIELPHKVEEAIVELTHS